MQAGTQVAIVPDELPDSLQWRIERMETAQKPLADMHNRLAAAQSEIDLLRTLADQGDTYAAAIKRVTNRPGVIASQPLPFDRVQQSVTWLNERADGLEDNVNAIKGEIQAAGTPGMVERLQSHLKAAEALDSRLSGGVLGKVGLNKPFGDAVTDSITASAADIGFIRSQVMGQKNNFSTQAAELENARWTRWKQAIDDIARWKDENEVVNLGIRAIKVSLQTVGDQDCCAIYRVAKDYRNGAQAWRVHSMARMLFLPFDPQRVANYLRNENLGCCVQNTLLADYVILLDENGERMATVGMNSVPSGFD